MKKKPEKTAPVNKSGTNKKASSVKTDEVSPLVKYANIIIILTALLVYIRVAGFDITGLDDNIILKDKIEQLSDFGNVGKAVLSPYIFYDSNYYRPVANLSFMLDAAISGSSPFIFHLTNILIHIIVCLLLFNILKLLKINILVSLFGTLIFAVHPLNTNAVVWIVGRNDLLATMFSLASMICFIKFIKIKKLAWLLVHYAFFLLAIGTKEFALVLPVIALTFLLLTKKKIIIIKLLFIAVGWLCITGLYFMLKNIALGGDLAESKLSFANFISSLPNIPEFISKFFIPFNLSPLPIFSLSSTVLGIILLIFIITIIYKKKNFADKYLFWFGIEWFLIFTVPGMFARLGDNYFDYLECRAYMPIIGLIIFIACLISSYPKLFNKKIYISSIISVLIILITINIIKSNAYSDNEHFLIESVNTSPKSALAHNNYGNFLKSKGKYKEAIVHFTIAGELNPLYTEAFYNRALAKQTAGDYRGAIEDYSKAIDMKPDYMDAFNNRSLSRQNVGDFKGAIEDINSAMKLKPGVPDHYYNKGVVEAAMGDLKSAIEDYSEAINLNPNKSSFYNNRGVAYGMLNELDKALDNFNSALKIEPNFTDALSNRGNAYFSLGIKDKACDDWSKAASLGSEKSKIFIKNNCGKK